MVLGPSLLSTAIPGVGDWILPQTVAQSHLLELVSLFGALFLLLLTGLETDLALIRHQMRTATFVAAGGLLLPFLSGLALGLTLPESLIGEGAERAVFAVFMATALSISSIAVIGRVLIDMDLMRRDIGQTIIAAAVIDDTIGWTALAIVAGLAGGAALTASAIGAILFRTLVFIAVSFVLGRLFVRRASRFIHGAEHEAEVLLSAVVILMCFWAALSSALDLEPVLGAFVAGLLVGQQNLPTVTRETLERIALGVFAPIFFAVAGLKVDLQALADARLAGLTVLLIIIATLGKVLGAVVGARLAGVGDHWRGLAFGTALNARAAMGIIIATVGLSLGLIAQDLFTMLVLMSMLTAVAAPPTLRWAVRHVELDPAEAERLAMAARSEGSWVLGMQRVLMPMRFDPESAEAPRSLESHVLDRLAAGRRLSITLFTVVPESQSDAARRYLEERAADHAPHTVRRLVLVGGSVAKAILAEAERGYHLVVLGARWTNGDSDAVYGSVVDEVVRLSPAPTMVVSARGAALDTSAHHRLTVPTNGRQAALQAAEIACALARDGHAELAAVHVIIDDRSLYAQTRGGSVQERRREAGEQVVQEVVALAAHWNVEANAHVLQGADVSEVLLDFVREAETDLLLLGTDVRAGSQRLTLGRRVEDLIARAPCAVVVVNMPR